MPCECTDRLNINNKEPVKNIKLRNNKILNLDLMSSMSIDEIVNLYKDGYRLEELADTANIVSMSYSSQCSGTPVVVINNTAGATGSPNLVTKGSVFAQRFYSTFRCLDWAQFLTKRLNNVNFKIEIREDQGGLPKGAPNTSTGLVLETSPISYSDLPTTIDYIYETISAVIQSDLYYWICFVPIDFYDSSTYRTGTENYRFNIYDGTYVNNHNTAIYYGGVWNGPYASTSKMAIYKLPNYVTPSNAQVFNVCWGPGLGTTCNIPPQQPVVTSGTTVTIKADITNTGSSGKIRAVFKIGNTPISDQNTESLATYPGGGFWSPTTTYLMPNNNVMLTIEGYGWDGASWVLTHTTTSTISATTPTCTGISIDASTVTANVGDTITLTAYNITPNTQPFTVTFTDRNNTVLGTCTTSGGTCSVQWNTTGKSQGTHYVKAAVIGQCTSTELAIGLSVPIQQWNVDINVKDSVTASNISEASVTVGTQTLQTDANGHVLFRVDQGTIYVTISKTGYNTINSDPQSVYNNVTFDYSLVPASQNPGTLRFITSPPGISGAEVHFIGDTPTLKGTTDINGTLSIGSLAANRVVNYEVRKTGYNVATGSKTVVGNVITDVMVTMTLLTTTGSVCIHSSPSGASIKIDNVLQTGKTTATSGGGCLAENTIGNLAAGSHSYELSLTAYQPNTGNVTITAGQTLDHDAGTLTPLPTLGTANISSTPSGARIHIMVDSIYQDTGYATGTIDSPAVISNLTAGTYSYKLMLTGYNDYLNTFVITAGQTTVVNPTLVQTPPATGTLSIWSFPPGAHIYTKLESGSWQDTTSITGSQINPTQITGLSPGNYSYKLTLTGYDDYIGPFVISTGQTTSANATLVQTGTTVTLTSISPANPTIQIGGIQQFIAKDQNNSTISTGVTWTKTAGVGTITTTGLYSAGSTAGTATISATYSGVTITTSITIPSVASTLTSISPANPSILVNSTQQFTAKDQNNSAISTGVTWAKVTGSGTISATGLYSSGVTAGTTTISATYSGVTITTSITIVETPPEEGGAGILFGIIGVAALGMMMSSQR